MRTVVRASEASSGRLRSDHTCKTRKVLPLFTSEQNTAVVAMAIKAPLFIYDSCNNCG